MVVIFPHGDILKSEFNSMNYSWRYFIQISKGVRYLQHAAPLFFLEHFGYYCTFTCSGIYLGNSVSSQLHQSSPFLYSSLHRITENKRSSIWQLCRYWWHRKLTFRQLTVLPVTTKCEIDDFLFSVIKRRNQQTKWNTRCRKTNIRFNFFFRFTKFWCKNCSISYFCAISRPTIQTFFYFIFNQIDEPGKYKQKVKRGVFGFVCWKSWYLQEELHKRSSLVGVWEELGSRPPTLSTPLSVPLRWCLASWIWDIRRPRSYSTLCVGTGRMAPTELGDNPSPAKQHDHTATSPTTG